MSVVHLNGEFLPVDEATVSVNDRGFLLGDGVYEVTPAYGGRLFRWEQHLARLRMGLAAIGIDFDAAALESVKLELLARNGLDCVSIGVEAESDSGHASRRRWRHEFRFTAAAVVDRVRWQLEGWYRSPDRPTGPVTLIRLTPCEVVPARGRQLGMWGERSEADERATRALARVQGLLGSEAVTVPRLAGGRRPADIGRRVPLHDAATERPDAALEKSLFNDL